MKLLILSLLAAAARAQSSTISEALTVLPSPTPKPVSNPLEYVGCYAMDNSLNVQYGYIFMTNGWCANVCLSSDSPSAVAGMTQKTDCYCSDSLPSQKVDDSKCDLGCAGFPGVKCGGNKYWSVWSTGLKSKDELVSGGSNSGSSSSSTDATSSSTSTIAKVSTVTQGGSVVTLTAAPTGTQATGNGSGGGGSNVGGIVAGVVVGILVMAAIIGGVIFFMRRRNKKALEEEHRRAQASAELMASKRAQAPSPFDTRLEPVMLQKRQSDGSIADHQDYSRRILQVRNPDA